MSDVEVQTVYSGRSTNWPMIWLTTALVVPLLVMGRPRGSVETWTTAGILTPILVVVVVAVLNLITATSVRTLAGSNGLTVYFGAFGWPSFHYPLARIQLVEVVEIPSSQWAWGIYWSPRRGLMLTLRTGPALWLELTNGRKVTISTPDPAAAAQAINTARAATR